tara:strand:+ start:306 stop:566 length:261 start_codon:yes stop_codon:yes gene_type:complete
MSSEKLIRETMKPLIKQVRDIAFIKGAYVTDREVLGIIISKYSEWSAETIMDIATEALRDSNFHKLADDLETVTKEHFRGISNEHG